MTTARLSAVAAAFCIAAPAAAAPLRGGEHDGFTRLAIEAEERVGVAVAVEGRTATVALSGPVPTVELDRAFERIGRDRIARLDWDAADGTLRIGMGCDCVPTVRQFSGLVVIDVAAAPDRAPSPEALPQAPPVASPATPVEPPPDPVTVEALERAFGRRGTDRSSDPAGIPEPPREPAGSAAVAPSVPVVVLAAAPAAARDAGSANPFAAEAARPAAPEIRNGPPLGVPLVLTPVAVPLSDRIGRALREHSVAARSGSEVPARPEPPAPRPDAAQIVTRDGRAGRVAPTAAAAPSIVCPDDGRLRALLAADPARARAELPDLVAGFTDGGVDAAEALRDGYLRAGLGVEALRVSRAAWLRDDWMDTLSDVLDPPVVGAAPSSPRLCGAAAAFVALVYGPPGDPLTIEDADDMARIAGSLPRERAAILLPPIIETLDGAGASALATRLRGTLNGSPTDDVAGIAESRAETFTGRLDAGAASRDVVQDALAALPTTPEGAARDGLVASTAAALAIEGDLGALASAMAEADPDQRSAVLAAITRLWSTTEPERRGVLAAALLRWRDRADSDTADRMARAAAEEGLAIVASRWRTPGREALPPPIVDPGLGDADQAWLSRDLDGVADTDAQTPRAQLAAAIVEAPTFAEADTFLGAQDRLEGARRTRDLISALIAEGDPGPNE